MTPPAVRAFRTKCCRFIWTLWIVFVCAFARAAESAAKPNIIFILSDDQGAWAMKAAGASEFQTPNLDRLAARGTSFPNSFVATPICTPSRMTFFTGRMPSHHGLQFHLVAASAEDNARPWLNGQPTFSEQLAANGYTLGLVGKWHMGGDLVPQAGFSYWRVLHGVNYKDPEVAIDGRWVKTPGFKTDIEGGFALEFVEQNKNRPFFLYWAANAPHRDYDFQPKEDREPYRGSAFPSFPRLPVHPWQNPNTLLMGDHGNEESKTSYAALVTGLDRNIGRLLDRLKELDLLDKTLIIFCSDNGYNCGHHGLWGKGSASVPFNLYDDTIRVPTVWSYPGHIPEGATIPQMVMNYDFFPTLLDYLGIPAAPDPKRVGLSYAPFLRGQTPAQWRDRVYFEYAYMRGVRTDTMKLIERTKDWPGEMFDLNEDPQETRNLFDTPERGEDRDALRKDLQAFFQSIGAPSLKDWAKTTAQTLPKYSTGRLPWYPLEDATQP